MRTGAGTGKVSTRGRASLRTLGIYAALAYAALGCGFAATAFAGVVPTDNGPVRGIETPTMKAFLGIPYAAPPVGDLRWRPPQPVSRWHGPRDASTYANHCPQGASPFGRTSNTEDCLYLNVYAPKRHAKHLPVMVWIHGGALVVGESDEYDPTRLVDKGAVVVTINYRLGYLGFLAHPALTAEGGGASGDYGFMDEQAALRWVQDNIGKFGGDAGDVTIFGESAGGLSVHTQLASPLAAGLFDRAIAQSGAYALELPSLAQAEAAGTSFAQAAGCADQTLACLRSLSADAVLASQPTANGVLVPNVDGRVLPMSLKAAFESGQFNRVPVIEGSTHDEFSLFAATNVEFVFGQLPPFFYPIVLGILLPSIGSNATPDQVLAEYPLGDYEQSVGRALTAIGTDALFACPGRRTARMLSQFVPTYAYEFADPDAPQLFVRPASFPYAAYHGSEVQYLFNLPNQTGVAGLNTDQRALADTMTRYWTQFARSGSPNSPQTPSWPAYTTANDAYMSLVPPTPEVVTDFAADHNCAFWDAL
jgi:para-nitrobenzyl esterase